MKAVRTIILKEWADIRRNKLVFSVVIGVPLLADTGGGVLGVMIVAMTGAGVTFSDGTPFDAEAVKFGLDRHRSGQAGAPSCETLRACPANSRASASSMSFVQDITVTGPRSLTVSLRVPWTDFAWLLATEPGMIPSPTALRAQCSADPGARPADCPFNRAPVGADWDAAVEAWRQLRSDDDAVFDAEVDLDATTLSPFVTWGTNPGQGLPLGALVPNPADIVDENEALAAERALAYMDLTPGTPLREVAVDAVFVGSCTNGRIEDLRAVADVLRGRTIADGVRMLVVPGSMKVRAQAEDEGLGEIFTAAGAEWRQAGCSMCLGMNPDQLAPGERCASTSNRNFEGRQGKGGRTHLVSPAVAAATAVRGTLSAPADL